MSLAATQAAARARHGWRGGPTFGAASAASSSGRYRLAPTLLVYGAILGAATGLVLLDALAGAIVMAIFALIGFSWREDMMPVLPAILTYQAIAISAGYFFYTLYGFFPGGGDTTFIDWSVSYSFVALFGILIGFRIGLTVLKGAVDASMRARDVNYSIERLFFLTAVLFSVNFVFDILPKQIWFGAAHIITNALALRFVAYFILLLVCLRRREGYGYAAAGTAIVMLPELLTGFSGFKEIMLIVLVSAAMYWKPWIRTRRQRAINRLTIFIGALMTVLVLLSGLIWTGGLKEAWRGIVWTEQAAEFAPIERMGHFFDVATESLDDLEIEPTVEAMAARFSSGTLYFAYVIERVPGVVDHEDGALLNLTLYNAMTPRILFPEKKNIGSDSWLVREYAGVQVAGAESGTSIGLGYPAEFYIDFGAPGIVVMSIVYGFVGAFCIAVFAWVARNREIMFALMAGLLTESMMAIEGSFIKLLPGMLQRTIIAAAVIFIVRRPLITLVTHRGRGGDAPGAPHALAGGATP